MLFLRRSTCALILSLAAISGCAEITGIEPGEPFPSDAGVESDAQPPTDVDVPCVDDNGCQEDSHCVNGLCKPWEAGGSDPSCIHVAPEGALSPTLKCSFEKAPKGDPVPDHVQVQTTPLIANFRGKDGPPTIVTLFSAPNDPDTYVVGYGVIRLLNGSDCTVEPLSDAEPNKPAVFGGNDIDGDGEIDWLMSSGPPALGDLDGDGVPEIVATSCDGSTYAFTRKKGAWSLLWKSKPVPGQLAPSVVGSNCNFSLATLAIHDLDGDGVPEILRDGAVLDHNGKVITPNAPGYDLTIGSPTLYWIFGLPPVAGHFLGDPATVQMTDGQKMWTWDAGAKAWQTYPGFDIPVPDTGLLSGLLPLGPAAVADFGAYGVGLAASAPEIVVAQGNTAAIYTIHGEVVMPPTMVAAPDIPPDITILNITGGGPPTIADFDGDGLPELAIALKTRRNMSPKWTESFLAVFDLDCGPSPRLGGVCMRGRCDHLGTNVVCPADGYLAWTRLTHDTSGYVLTASAAFDFEGDGKAELMYGDQCFNRVYDGRGEVIGSLPRGSATYIESPIVADVNGDFRGDLIVTSSQPAYPDECEKEHPGGLDAQFAGIRCELDHDCLSGSCVKGLCRCTQSAECCAEKDSALCESHGQTCAPPPAGTPGDGNTCRASRPDIWQGVRVYGDAHDNWARARTIYNQLSYSVTNVNDDGTIPSTPDWSSSWLTSGLNSYHESAMSDGLDRRATFDATIGGAGSFTCDTSGATSGATLHTTVCNRGASPLPKGLPVGFYVGTKKVCGAETTKALSPGECDDKVACTWADAPGKAGEAVSVEVLANDGGKFAECKAGNNRARVDGVFCAK